MRQGAPSTEPDAADCWSAASRARRYDSEGNRRFYVSALGRLLEGAPVLRGRGLDLGCGTGFSTEVLLDRLPEVAWRGADASAVMLALARCKPTLAAVELVHARADSLPFPDESFDVVVASFAWHWFGAGAGSEVRRVLRPGGWLLATVPLRQRASASGNRVLARALLADRRAFAVRTSQGLRPRDLRHLLPPPVGLARADVVVERERFADGAELVDVLDSRGALAAVFGARVPELPIGPGPLEIEWPFAVVHLQRIGER